MSANFQDLDKTWEVVDPSPRTVYSDSTLSGDGKSKNALDCDESAERQAWIGRATTSELLRDGMLLISEMAKRLEDQGFELERARAKITPLEDEIKVLRADRASTHIRRLNQLTIDLESTSLFEIAPNMSKLSSQFESTHDQNSEKVVGDFKRALAEVQAIKTSNWYWIVFNRLWEKAKKAVKVAIDAQSRRELLVQKVNDFLVDVVAYLTGTREPALAQHIQEIQQRLKEIRVLLANAPQTKAFQLDEKTTGALVTQLNQLGYRTLSLGEAEKLDGAKDSSLLCLLRQARTLIDGAVKQPTANQPDILTHFDETLNVAGRHLDTAGSGSRAHEEIHRLLKIMKKKRHDIVKTQFDFAVKPHDVSSEIAWRAAEYAIRQMPKQAQNSHQVFDKLFKQFSGQVIWQTVSPETQRQFKEVFCENKNHQPELRSLQRDVDAFKSAVKELQVVAKTPLSHEESDRLFAVARDISNPEHYSYLPKEVSHVLENGCRQLYEYSCDWAESDLYQHAAVVAIFSAATNLKDDLTCHRAAKLSASLVQKVFRHGHDLDLQKLKSIEENLVQTRTGITQSPEEKQYREAAIRRVQEYRIIQSSTAESDRVRWTIENSVDGLVLHVSQLVHLSEARAGTVFSVNHPLIKETVLLKLQPTDTSVLEPRESLNTYRIRGLGLTGHHARADLEVQFKLVGIPQPFLDEKGRCFIVSKFDQKTPGPMWARERGAANITPLIPPPYALDADVLGPNGLITQVLRLRFSVKEHLAAITQCGVPTSTLCKKLRLACHPDKLGGGSHQADIFRLGNSFLVDLLNLKCETTDDLQVDYLNLKKTKSRKVLRSVYDALQRRAVPLFWENLDESFLLGSARLINLPAILEHFVCNARNIDTDGDLDNLIPRWKPSEPRDVVKPQGWPFRGGVRLHEMGAEVVLKDPMHVADCGGGATKAFWIEDRIVRVELQQSYDATIRSNLSDGESLPIITTLSRSDTLKWDHVHTDEVILGQQEAVSGRAFLRIDIEGNDALYLTVETSKLTPMDPGVYEVLLSGCGLNRRSLYGERRGNLTLRLRVQEHA